MKNALKMRCNVFQWLATLSNALLLFSNALATFPNALATFNNALKLVEQRIANFHNVRVVCK